jgi:hypothetical protein
LDATKESDPTKVEEVPALEEEPRTTQPQRAKEE